MAGPIIHLDMDAFFAAVEQLDRPELRGKPVLVGGRERGVVAACSYEARPYGIRSAMPMSRARRLCPHAVILPGRMARYRQLSREVFAIFARFTDRIEPLSIDEGFLDVSGCERLFGPAETIAARIRREVRTETGLTVSAGVAPNKFLAKLASESAKPDGLLVLEPEEVDSFLLPMPVERLWGVGPRAAAALKDRGCRIVADLRQLGRGELEKIFGTWGARLYELARGEDRRPVATVRETKSVGAEETFARDLTGAEPLQRELLSLAGEVARRLRGQGLTGTILTLKVRYGDFQTVTRRRTLAEAAATAPLLYRTALELLQRTEAGRRPVRLLGLTVSGLGDIRQQQLFPDPVGRRLGNLDQALDSLEDRFGRGRVRPGTLLDHPSGEEGGEPGEGA